MGMTFEALTGVLGLDSSGWDRGFSNAYGTLGKFNQSVSRDLARAAATANVSITEMAERAEQLSQTLGTTLGSAATMLADALESPVKGIEALRTAGLKFSEAQREEIRTLSVSGQAFDAHDVILNRIAESYGRLQSNIDDLNVSADLDSDAARARVQSLEEELNVKNDIARFDEQIRQADLQYEAALLDDLNAKWAEQAELKRKGEEYRNVGVTKNRPTSQMTNSELAAMGGSGIDLSAITGMVPGLRTLLAGGGVGAIVGASLREFANAEQEQARLQAVLKATGADVADVTKSYGEMSAALQKATIYTGGAITESQIYLTSLKLGESATRDALNASADLAAVMGTDLTDASRTLGRALADPENGAAALRRAGILLSDAQQEQIKSFMALNDVAAAQRVILDEVASRTGGAAAAAADTLIGRWQKLKNDASNLGEAIGTFLVNPLETLDGVLARVSETAATTAAALAGNQDVVKGLGGEAGGAAFNVERRLNNYLAERDKAHREQYGVGMTQQQLAAASQDFHGLSQDQQLQYNFNGGAAVNMAGESQANLLAAAQAGNGMAQAGLSGATLSQLEEERRAKERKAQLSAQYQAGVAAEEKAAKDADREKRAKAAEDFANSEEGKQAYANAGADDAVAYLDAMQKELNDLVSSGEVEFDKATGKLTADSEKAIDAVMRRYGSALQAMPGMTQSAFAAMSSSIRENLWQAAQQDSEDQKEIFLRNAANAADEAKQIYIDHEKKTKEDAKKLTDEQRWQKEYDDKQNAEADAKKKKQFLIDQGLMAPDEAKPNEKVQFNAGASNDPLAWMQTANRNDLQGAVGNMRQQFQASAANMRLAGIGTPEQQRGLIAFGNQVQEVMRRVRDSTGDARAANIEELRKMQEAWAKAFQAIRDGSKETVDQLVKDAKKQAEAGADAAKKTGAEARRERIKARQDADAAQGGLANSMNAIAQQGAAMSQSIMGALSMFSRGAGDFNALLEQAQSPLEKIDLLITNTTAQINGLSINAGASGGLSAINQLQTSLRNYQRERAAIMRQEAADREEAEKRQQEAFRRERAQRANTADELNDPNGRNAIIGTAGGAPINITFNGVHNAKQMADIVVGEVNRRGYDRGPRRQPFNRR